MKVGRPRKRGGTPEIRRERAHHRNYMREYVRRLRREWVEANGPCQRCGSKDSLEIDHIDPRTKCRGMYWTWAKARREAELAKCQVLCRGCHVIKTSTERRAKAAARRAAKEVA